MKKLFKKEYTYILLLIAISTLAIYPLFKEGLYPFHDEPNIAHLHQMTRALSEGQFPPRWIPDASYNFGNPYYIYFYHLPFYIGSLFNLLFGLTLISSFKLVIILSVFLSVILFYLLMRRFFNPLVSLSSASVYLFTPYRAVDIYVRGSFGEVWGFVFMPLILLSLLRLSKERSGKNVFLLGLGVFGLILSHNSSAFIFLPLAIIFGLILVFVSKYKKYVFKSLIFAFTLGIGLSAYYWMPAVIESKYIQPGSPFNLIDHFPFIRQLVIPSWGYGASVWGPDDGLSFQVGILNLLLVLISPFSYLLFKDRWSKHKRALFSFSFTSFLLAIFFMNIRSLPLWNLIPLSTYIQFPWRLLLLTTLFSSILGGFAIEALHKKFKYFYIPLVFVVLAIGLTWNYFKPEKIIKVDDDYYLRRFFANITSEGRTDTLSDEYKNNIEDYLPVTIWTDERPLEVPKSKIEVLDGQVEFEEISSTYYKAFVDSDKGTTLTLHSYYFPGWKAWVDGRESEIIPQSPHGDMKLIIDPGEHSVVIRFTNTPVRTTSNLISLVTWTGMISYPLWRKRFS
ncbi:glycosyltransferase family 39 protein [Patescibacteria group bacterium]|nr:glycosyltransferase family 39 protein [Patescibacteria group bacterium]